MTDTLDAPVPQDPAAVAFSTGIVIVAAFQVILALGVPWGRAAWGGTHRVLPRRLRIASALAVPVLVAAMLLVLGRAGMWITGLPYGIFEVGIWVLFGFLVLSTIANLVSRSPWERFISGPVTLALAALCLVVALSEPPTS